MKKHESDPSGDENKPTGSTRAQPDAIDNDVPPIPLIGHQSNRQVGYRDTLERVVCVIELLAEMDYGTGLSPKAETGLYWVQMMLIESLNYVSQALETETRAE